MTTEAPVWDPSLNPADGIGRNRNTFRQILTLKVGDSINLGRIVEGAASIKSAYIWRTKDGWEVRLTSYSGAYGFSVEAEELKENNAIFDDLLRAGDVDPPFQGEKECACTCGAPCKSRYLPGHDQREKLLTGQVEAPQVAPAEIEVGEEPVDEVPVDEVPVEPPVEASEPEVAPDTEGEISQPSDTEEPTTDATPAPESAAVEPEAPKRDEYGEWFNQQILSPPKSTPQASKPPNDERLRQSDVYESLDGMLDPGSYSPKGDNINVQVSMIGIRDGFVSVTPFPRLDVCNCGCGAPSGKRRYLPSHDLRHRAWLVDKARSGDRRAYATLRGYGWLKYLYPDGQVPDSTSVDHVYSPARVPAGLPISPDVFSGYAMLDPGPGSQEQKIKRLTARRDAAKGAVARALLNEALYRLRGGYDRAMPIKPSYDRAKVMDLAFRLAAADVGVFYGSEKIAWSRLTNEIREQIQKSWNSRKSQLVSDAEELMDYADLNDPVLVTAGRMSAALLRRAVQAGLVGPVPYEMASRFPSVSSLFDPAKVKSGDDEERYSAVREETYEKYRGYLEFSGQDFNPMAKFYNYLAIEIADGRKPEWVTGDGDPWELARDAIQRNRYSDSIIPYWSEWWLAHGHESAVYSPTHVFRVLAKNAHDYMLTKGTGSRAVAVGDGGLHDMTLEAQRLNDITERGRAVFVERSPFEDDYFMMARKGEAFVGWGRVRSSDVKRVTKVFADAGALGGTNLPMGGGSAIKWDSDRRQIAFSDLSPRMVIRWLGDNFGTVLEQNVPFNHFFLGNGRNGYPTILQNAYLDGSATAQLNDWGVVHQVAGGAKALSEIAQDGAILSSWDLRRRGRSAVGATSESDSRQGLDEFVYAGLTNRGGKEFLTRAENLFVMKSEVLFGHGLLFAGHDLSIHGDRRAKYDNYMKGWGGSFSESLPVEQIASPQRLSAFRDGSAEVNIPNELRLEDVVALVVPDSYINDADATEAIDSIRKINPEIEIHYVDGGDTSRRSKAREVITRYNRAHGLAAWNLNRPERPVSTGDLVVASGDGLKSDMAWYNVYPMEVTRNNANSIYGRLRATPATRDWLDGNIPEDKREDANVWLASAIRSGVINKERQVQEVQIDPNHVVWFSPRLES